MLELVAARMKQEDSIHGWIQVRRDQALVLEPAGAARAQAVREDVATETRSEKPHGTPKQAFREALFLSLGKQDQGGACSGKSSTQRTSKYAERMKMVSL